MSNLAMQDDPIFFINVAANLVRSLESNEDAILAALDRAKESVIALEESSAAKQFLQEPRQITEVQIKQMVDRFLGWELPEDFNPDGGISFKKMRNENTPWPAKNTPTGTNLLDAVQAEKMVHYMLEGLAPAPAEAGQEEKPVKNPFETMEWGSAKDAGGLSAAPPQPAPGTCQHLRKDTHPATRDIWICKDCGVNQDGITPQAQPAPQDVIEKITTAWQEMEGEDDLTEHAKAAYRIAEEHLLREPSDKEWRTICRNGNTWPEAISRFLASRRTPEKKEPELSDYQIQMIHAGLMIPSEKAIISMSREIRKWRGVKEPDSI